MLKDLRTKTKNELTKELEKARKDLATLRFEKSLGKLKDTSKIRKAKKLVAQALTIISEKEILESLKTK